MIKKTLLIIILIFTIITTIYFTFLLREKIFTAKQIFTNKIITDKIINLVNYQDEFIKLNKIMALQKQVQIYQWIEGHNNKYTKKWADKIINSSQFTDETKNNNCNINTYSDKNIIIDKIITQNNAAIEQKYFINKIQYIPLIFDKKVMYGLPVKINNNTNKNTTYTDLDSYVSSIDNKIVHIEKDKFNVINGNILYSGTNYNNPEICDIKITYKYFNPENITFLNSNIVDFNKTNFVKIITIKKIFFLITLLSIVSIIMFCIKIILTILQKIPNFTLYYIPFFNEYFTYSKYINFNTCCIAVMLLCVASDCWIFGFIPLMFLMIARQVDYWKI